MLNASQARAKTKVTLRETTDRLENEVEEAIAAKDNFVTITFAEDCYSANYPIEHFDDMYSMLINGGYTCEVDEAIYPPRGKIMTIRWR